MALLLSDLTSAQAVQAALDEYAQVGQATFLARHGFGRASALLVRNPLTGEWADSKAIAGVALGIQHPGSGGLKASQFSGGAATVKRRLEALGFELKSLSDIRGDAWNSTEVALVVADYLTMLVCELSGQRYNKTTHRRALLHHLPGRTSGAVEFKHANISAVLLDMGYPYLKGYQPRSNYQRHPLVDEVALQASHHPLLDVAVLSATERPAVPATGVDYTKVRTDVPVRELVARESAPAYLRPAIQRDYFARESQNRSLGRAGEEFALQFERWRLAQSGLIQLADQVKHVAADEGDGLGYDIRSFDTDGQPRFIEVKTTAFGERTPFYVSANELRFSRDQSAQFRLYRLFDFRAVPRLFELSGAIDRHCHLDATSYRASFG